MKKKIVLVLVMALLAMSMVSGCTKDEASFYSLIKEVNDLSALKGNGIVKVKVNGPLVSEMSKELPKELKGILKGIEFRYTLKQSKKPLLANANVEVRYIGENQYRPFTEVMLKGDKTYIKVDDLVKFLKPYILLENPDAEAEINKIIKEVQYVDTDNEQSINNPEIVNKIVNIIKEAFDDIEIKSVVKKNGKDNYEVNIDTKVFNELFQELVSYVVKNNDKVFNTIIDGINKLSDEEIKELIKMSGNSVKTKEEIIDGIKELKEESKTAEVKDLEEELKELQGSKINYKIKKENKNYKLSMDFDINAKGLFSLEINESWAVKPIKRLSVEAPNKSTSVEKFSDMMESISEKTDK